MNREEADLLQPGHMYRVRKDFQALRDSFTAGEKFVYVHDSYDRDEEYTTHVFIRFADQTICVWDEHKDEDAFLWKSLFQQVVENE